MNAAPDRLANRVLDLPRPLKRTLALLVDAALCAFTVWLAYFLRLDEWIRLTGDGYFKPYWAVLASVVIALPLFVTHGFYRVIFRYADLSTAWMVARAFALYGLLYALLVTAVGLPGVPRSVGIIQPLLLVVAVGASRALVRYWLGGLYQQIVRRMHLPKAVIYGAGSSGRQLATALANSQDLQLAAFVDDDLRLQGQVMQGHTIHAPAALARLVQDQGVRTVLLAMPSLTRARRNAILAELRPLRVAVRTLPRVDDMVQGRLSAADLHELDIDDLLGRDPVAPDTTLLARNVAGKVVLVTGAGGSIGSELCRQILAVGPARLLLLELSEFALYAIHHELQERLAGRGIELLPLLGSVQDAPRMQAILRRWQPHTVYHAAAYKHVPLVEHNPVEGVRNNVLGTLATARAAAAHGVADFVLISTDKAVRPTNVMGASKRLAELVLQALAQENPATRFTMVRFGNVLGSSGSVVPKFREQIRAGGPITLTHPDITRYFMTIPEAAQLVIQAGAMGQGGDVFLLDMGQPVRILDLACRMVELSGLSVRDADHPDGDIAIELTGLRPGEKLYEELLIGDNPQPTAHARIMKAREASWPPAELWPRLQALQDAMQAHDLPALRSQLQALVPGYAPRDGIVDWVYQAG